MVASCTIHIYRRRKRLFILVRKACSRASNVISSSVGVLGFSIVTCPMMSIVVL